MLGRIIKAVKRLFSSKEHLLLTVISENRKNSYTYLEKEMLSSTEIISFLPKLIDGRWNFNDRDSSMCPEWKVPL